MKSHQNTTPTPSQQASTKSPKECDELLELMELRATGLVWFINTRIAESTPTETEIVEFYEKHPSEMMEEGRWKLTTYRFTPRSSADTQIQSLNQALKIADEARKELLGGAGDEALRGKYTTAGLVIHASAQWAKSSDVGPIDMELLKEKPGYISSTHAKDNSAIFVRLDEARTPKPLPLDAKRAYINDVLRTMKVEKALQKEMDETSASINLRIIP